MVWEPIYKMRDTLLISAFSSFARSLPLKKIAVEDKVDRLPGMLRSASRHGPSPPRSSVLPIGHYSPPSEDRTPRDDMGSTLPVLVYMPSRIAFADEPRAQDLPGRILPSAMHSHKLTVSDLFRPYKVCLDTTHTPANWWRPPN